MTTDDTFKPSADGFYDVHTTIKDPQEVRTWVETNLDPKTVETITAYATENGDYRVTITLNEIQPATMTRIVWGKGRTA